MHEHLIKRADIEALPEAATQHQFNDNAVRHSRALATKTGMQRIGIHLVRIEPGKDSTTHHFHDADEEFIYILSGQGVARIGDEEFDVEAGDFMGFPAPSPAHSLRNPHSEDLTYLMGGEKWAVDIVHYPGIRRSMTKAHGKRVWAAWEDSEELPPRDT